MPTFINAMVINFISKGNDVFKCEAAATNVEIVAAEHDSVKPLSMDDCYKEKFHAETHTVASQNSLLPYCVLKNLFKQALKYLGHVEDKAVSNVVKSKQQK